MTLKVTRNSLHLQAFEPEQLKEAVSKGNLEHYLLAKSDCETRLLHWAAGGVSIDSGSYSFPVRAVGGFPTDHICLGYMKRQTSQTWVNGLTVGLETLVYYPAGSELDYSAGRGGEWAVIGLKEQDLQEVALRRLGRELQLPEQGPAILEVNSEQRLALDSQAFRLLDCPSPTPEMIDSLLLTTADLLMHVQNDAMDSLIQRWRHRQRLLHRADAYLWTHADRPFDAKALASYVGITPRTLQRHFLDVYGITPREWARSLALHRVRRNLRRADQDQLQVKSVAREFGFRHMGRFAQYYEELFGELPSTTILESSEVLNGN